jgi:hypothetical protein
LLRVTDPCSAIFWAKQCLVLSGIAGGISSAFRGGSGVAGAGSGVDWARSGIAVRGSDVDLARSGIAGRVSSIAPAVSGVGFFASDVDGAGTDAAFFRPSSEFTERGCGLCLRTRQWLQDTSDSRRAIFTESGIFRIRVRGWFPALRIFHTATAGIRPAQVPA